jgi:hypothetical protein
MRIIQTIFLLLLIIVTYQSKGEKVSKDRAEKVAINWLEKKIGIKSQKALSKSDYFILNNDTSLYIFNFENEGFVIVAGDDHSFPILGYSDQGKVDLKKIEPEFESWLNYYSEMIVHNKTQKNNAKAKQKWSEIETANNLKSMLLSVTSLFESTGSSSWAVWYPYYNKAPQSTYAQGTNGCVPGRLAEIMKYYRYPRIGNGSNTYSYDGVTISENFNKIYHYEDMPYRLTYCGNGHPTCNDGSFDIIPGITQNNINEVGWLQYHAGVSVEMMWLGDRGHPDSVSTGTFGVTEDWVQSLVDYFNYSPDYDYWSGSRIQNSTSDFKSKVRENLDDDMPILFRYATDNSGHAVIIDGYEDDDFFHIIFGRGGYMNGYYYLFSSDADGIHEPRPYIDKWGLNATCDIYPDCPIQNDVYYSNQSFTISEGRLLEAKENLFISNTTVPGDGSDGARLVLRAANSVNITSDFEVQLGAQMAIFVETCGTP